MAGCRRARDDFWACVAVGVLWGPIVLSQSTGDEREGDATAAPYVCSHRRLQR